MGIHSYVNSDHFMLDFMPIRTGDYTIEWSVIRRRGRKNLTWMNGHLMNVSSAKRVRGTFNEFVEYVSKKIQRAFKDDPEVRFCRETVMSFISDLHFTKAAKG